MENVPNYISLSKAFKGSTVFDQKGKEKKRRKKKKSRGVKGKEGY